MELRKKELDKIERADKINCIKEELENSWKKNMQKNIRS